MPLVQPSALPVRPRQDADEGRSQWAEASAAQAAPTRPRARALSALITGAIGAATILALASWGHTDALSAGSAAAGVAFIGAALSYWDHRRAGRDQTSEGAAALADAGVGDAHDYALALEFAPDPMMLVKGGEPDDMAGRRIGFANAAARELLRVPREGALLVAALRHPDVLEAVDESLFGGLDRSLAYETGGAHNRSWRLYAKPLPSASPHERLALVTLRDETDVLLNERRRSDFLANASHELRTPLASLTGFIETLRGHARTDDAARERFLAIMSRQAERMARLIDDLLSLSRIEMSEHVRPSGVCDLALVVGDVLDALAPQVAAKAVKLAVRTPPSGAGAVTGDRDQILQVVQNLLDNAVKYSRAGMTVEIEVEPGLTLEAASAPRQGGARMSDPQGGRMSLLSQSWTEGARYVLLRISDQGQGMAREHLPRLTERFYRVEGQKSGDGGTGLGLAIVKHIVNRHRGGFYVESAPGCGALFCVYLPQAPQAPAAQPPGPQASGPPPSVTPPSV